MKGESVIVRAFGGEPLLRYVWSIGTKVIYITNNAEDEPIGFPKEDVFKFNPVLAKSMEKLYRDKKWDWNKLILWSDIK